MQASYKYDANGMRTSKTVNGVKSQYQYVDGKLYYEKRGENEMYFTYDSYGNLSMIHLYRDGEVYTYYAVCNSRGDVKQLYTGNGNLRVEYKYDAWGNTVSVTNGDLLEITDPNDIGNLNPIRYRGYYWDSETNLYYLQSRYYDPTTMRFINADGYMSTAQDLTGNNLYIYCANNPVNLSDSSGLWFGLDDLIAGAVGAVVSVGGQFVSDLVSSAVNGEWSFSSWETYVGAGVGGAAGGVVSLYGGPVVGGAVSGGVSTFVGQGLEKLTGANDRSAGQIAFNTAVNSGIGALTANISPDISGITSGRNSYAAVYKSGLTKIGNETANRMSAKVITKGIVSGITGDIYIDLVNGMIPGATYWYDGVGTANGGKGSRLCYYNGQLYVVDGIHYGMVFE